MRTLFVYFEVVPLEEQERDSGLAGCSIGTGDGPTTWAAPVLSDVRFAAHAAAAAGGPMSAANGRLSGRRVVLELEAFVVPIRGRQHACSFAHRGNGHIVLFRRRLLQVASVYRSVGAPREWLSLSHARASCQNLYIYIYIHITATSERQEEKVEEDGRRRKRV